MTDFSGTWEVVSSPDFGYEYLSMEVSPYVTLRQRGERIEGEYQVGLQCGRLLGHVADESFFYFDFGGNDEMEDAGGSGEGTLEGRCLTFELWHHRGDGYAFHCERRR